MNKKGFTLFELLASFIIISFIVYFMTSVVLNIKDTRYKITVDFELQSYAGQIIQEIEKDINENGINSLSSCGVNCVNIDYGEYTKNFSISADFTTITYDETIYILPNDSYIDSGNVTENIACDSGTSCIYDLDIPIKHYEVDKTYHLKYSFQYSSGDSSFTDDNFSGEYTYSDWSTTYPEGEYGIESKTQYRSRTADKYVEFDGVDDYIAGTILPITQQIVTIDIKTAVVKQDIDSITVTQRCTTTANFHCRGIKYEADSDSYLYWSRDNSNAWQNAIGVTPYSNNEVVWATGVQNGTSLKVYVDGILDNSYTMTGYKTTYQSYWRIGKYTDSDSVPLTGNVYELRIWSTALSEEDINSYHDVELNGDESGLVAYYKFDEGSGTVITDYSVNGNNLTLNGGARGINYGEYSAWQDAEITAGSELDVDTRTVYRYIENIKPDWDNRVVLTIDESKIGEKLYHFPLTVYLNSANGTDDVFDELGDNNKRMKFVTSTGTELYAEIEYWNSTNKEATIHISSEDFIIDYNDDTVVYMYYDNDQRNNVEHIGEYASTIGQNVWDEFYHKIDHMGSTYEDSTNNGNDGTNTSATATTGMTGVTSAFNGSAYVTYPSAAVPPGSEITMTLLAYTGATDSNSMFMASTSGTYRVLGAHLPYSGATLYWDAGPGGATAYDRISVAIPDADHTTYTLWNYTKNANTTYMRVYRNDTEYLSGSGKTQAIGTGALSLVLGGAVNGEIDEFRISIIERSPYWVKAEYNSLFDSLITYTVE